MSRREIGTVCSLSQRVIKDRNLRKRLQKFCRISTLKSSNVPIRPADLWCCPNAGSSSAPLPGSIAAEGSPRIGRISTERRSRSCASPQSASCSENSAIRPEVSGRTLRDRPRGAGHRRKPAVTSKADDSTKNALLGFHFIVSLKVSAPQDRRGPPSAKPQSAATAAPRKRYRHRPKTTNLDSRFRLR